MVKKIFLKYACQMHVFAEDYKDDSNNDDKDEYTEPLKRIVL